ncbi:Signal transduction histidine-protein kinase BarA [Symmachiella macrocystis]|uniref:Sensory/regulatory protein RpfC n=1 Tax=Symmachiella macrocystis TaxID=2527985 RepID=A0A5C6B3Z2_9PLAN|nr:ATP-binding protein [Symmachiella macrocystis]TWU05204.1 Signal transduction histidine-protein kinase BarA [Symmachiella macrocystis]
MTEWLLKKTGAHYILAMMILTRPICLIGGGLTIYYINLTMNLDARIFHLLISYSSILIPTATALTVFMALHETRTLRKVLAQLGRGGEINAEEGMQAGREAVVFPRVHHRTEAIYVTFICVVLFCALLVFLNQAPLKVAIQISFAGFVGIASVLMGTFFASERWMVPVINLLMRQGVTIDYPAIPVGKIQWRMNISFGLTILVTALMIGALANQRAWEISENPDQAVTAVTILRRHTFFITMAAFAVGLFLSRMLANSVASRIDMLMTAMKQVQDGTLSKRVLMTGNDEIDVLGRQFNLMVGKLQQDDFTIRDLNTNLEQKVQTRTSELEIARADAESANRSKSDFIANISHELRTPLNGVIGMTELLLNTTLNTQQRKYAKVAGISGTTLLELLNEVLDYSKIEAGKLEIEHIDFKLLDVVEPVLEIAAHRCCEKGIALACYVDPSIPLTVKGDPGRVRQILNNLMNNAIKFTEQGSIVLCVELDRVDGATTTLRFSVADTGIGIPPTRFDRLFKSFSQVDASTTRQYGGTGLGLSICKELCALMKGHIGFESQVGTGSTFAFSIPFEMLPEQNLSFSQVAADLKGQRVLLIKQDSVARSMLHNQLKAWGCLVDAESAANEAMDRLYQATAEEQPYHTVLIEKALVDSEMVAWITLAHTETTIREPRLIQLVALTDQIDEPTLRKQGFFGSLAIPVLPSELINVIGPTCVDSSQSDDAMSAARMRTELRGNSQQRKLKKTGHSNARILVAEDNYINQEVVAEILSNAGYTCHIVANGRLALETVRNERYDLVLMDCQMPEMDGLEATRAIREFESGISNQQSKTLPIVALTASALTGERERCLAAGMNGYLSKPLDPVRLIETIEAHLSQGDQTSPQVDDGHDASCPSDDSCDESDLETKSNNEDSADVLDVDGLLRRCNGKLELAERLLGKFHDRLDGDLQKIEDSVESCDLKRTATLAHALKGSSSNLSAERIRQAATDLEEVARTDDVADLYQFLEQLKTECELFLNMEPTLSKHHQLELVEISMTSVN